MQLKPTCSFKQSTNKPYTTVPKLAPFAKRAVQWSACTRSSMVLPALAVRTAVLSVTDVRSVIRTEGGGLIMHDA
jgi:hypothetical protein